jgi:7,8-dihydropterin-6-yl-methyl-4-(beta-D-ribofuranosyl)aminobenzene 5'-phosphate synthase
MKTFLKIIGGIFLVIVIALAGFIIIKTNDVDKGKVLAEQEYKNARVKAFENFGSVKNLSILPIIDYFAAEPGLKTEAGVSYLIKADNTTILLDVGFNQDGAHPSPLLQNMEKLGLKLKDIDLLFISHLHPDHVGGLSESRKQTFSLTQGKLDLSGITAYVPEEMKQSIMTPVGKIIKNSDPFILKPGIGSIGAIPRHLFIMGKGYEQSLAVNVEGKGIVLIIGCGHQGIDKILERTRTLFKEPIYAIIGGLHYPVPGGRSKIGPVDFQYIVATDAPPWRGLNESDVLAGIERIKESKAEIVALSPHDSSDWALGKFKEQLGKRSVELKVGREIKI